MKNKYITDYRKDESFTDTFLVIKKDVKLKKAGGDYLFTVLGDKSGTITGFLWDNVDAFRDRFATGDVVQVTGTTKEYNGVVQVTIHKIRKTPPESFRKEDYLPSSERDSEATFADFLELLRGEVSDPHLAALAESIFSDEKVSRRFKSGPAAKALHHAYLGGLLEHTLSVMRLSVALCREYPSLNRSLLVCGAALHDLGKIRELSWDMGFEYTDEGRLVGHITMLAIFLDRKIRDFPEFPAELRVELLHMVLSHHGELEFGSPKRPKTLEALALSHLDDLDAKARAFVESVRQPSENENWTAYNTQFSRFLYRKRFLVQQKESPASEGSQAGAPPPPEGAVPPQC